MANIVTEEKEIKVLDIVDAMASVLLGEKNLKNSEDAIYACSVIEDYMENNGIDGYSVDIDVDERSASISVDSYPKVSFTFAL